jgi:hypothetical protein
MPDISAMSDAIVLDWALAVAALLAMLHVAAPQLRGVLRRHTAVVGSLGGGMAVTYVFLHLFPELEIGESIFGRRIHVLVLAGFLVYYGLEHSLGLRESKHGTEVMKRGRFICDLTLAWTYSWLLLYALPDSLKTESLAIIPLLLAVGLHQAHADFELSEAYERGFDSWGRYVLASGPLAGWVTDLFCFKSDPLVSSVCTALLAGSCLYKTFKRQLPESGNARFRWFLAGVVLFILLNLLAGENFFSDRIL